MVASLFHYLWSFVQLLGASNTWMKQQIFETQTSINVVIEVYSLLLSIWYNIHYVQNVQILVLSFDNSPNLSLLSVVDHQLLMPPAFTRKRDMNFYLFLLVLFLLSFSSLMSSLIKVSCWLSLGHKLIALVPHTGCSDLQCFALGVYVQPYSQRVSGYL